MLNNIDFTTIFKYRFVSRNEIEAFYNAYLSGTALVDSKFKFVMKSLNSLDEYRIEHNRKYVESGLMEYQDDGKGYNHTEVIL